MSRARGQIRTPLDFLVVTDHAEFMGVISEIAAGNEELMATELGQRWKLMLEDGRGGEVFFEIVEVANRNPASLMFLNSENVRRTVWESIVDAAE